MNNTELFFQQLEADLPAVVARKNIRQLTGGLVAPHTLANADSQGIGPMIKIRIGKHVGYTRESFIDWLRTRIK